MILKHMLSFAFPWKKSLLGSVDDRHLTLFSLVTVLLLNYLRSEGVILSVCNGHRLLVASLSLSTF